MAKFRFPLQKVVQHRKVLENIAQSDFQQAQAALNFEIEKLQQMEQQILNARDEAFKRQSEGGRAGPGLTWVHEFIKGQDIRTARQKEKIAECESLVEKLREILRQRAIDYKIVEGLKEKKRLEFKTEQAKLEQKIVDESNVMRFRRQETEE